jgi:hypothetical protein
LSYVEPTENQLPVPAAVKAATAAVAATVVAAITSARVAAPVPTSYVAVTAPVPIAAVSIATAVAISATVAVIPIVVVATIEAPSVVPVIPRAGANKHAAYKVARTIKAVGSAVIGIVVVVSIFADRSRPVSVITPVCRTYSYAYRNLCWRSSSNKKQNS